jgi:4-hydroxybenzoate polyprenyltransferase
MGEGGGRKMRPGSILKKSTVAIYVALLLIGFIMMFILPPVGFVIVLFSALLLVIYAVLTGRGKGP